MEDFKNGLKIPLQKHIEELLKDVTVLFEVRDDSDPLFKDKLWATYLDSFPAGTNEKFRERAEHDCSACRHFVKAFGNVVTIKNNVVTTIWDFETGSKTYQPVVDALSAFVKSYAVSDFFITKLSTFGINQNYEAVNGETLTWDHLYTKIPASLVSRSLDTEASIQGKYRDIRNVFKRSLAEITPDSVSTVLELIAQKSLYKGEEHEALLKQFQKIQRAFLSTPENLRDNFCWEQSFIVGASIGKIRNHAIGTLLMDISIGTDLDSAVAKFEAMVAPENYKRPKAIFTKKMLEDAKKKLEELGFMESLGRRYARLEDITINNVLYSNRDSAKRMTGVFDKLANTVAINPKTFDRVDEISMEDFVKNVLPTVKNMEVLFENKHSGNMVSLITAIAKDSPSLFKWSSPASWAYTGNVTDSMKERVKAAGGKVDGVLRASLQWNENLEDHSDLDIHCVEPTGVHIYWSDRNSYDTGGKLDVDNRDPAGRIAVENITWPDLRKMPEGIYKFYVHGYSIRGKQEGFTAEIEFAGQIFSFAYNKPVNTGHNVQLAEVHYSKKDGFKLVEKLPSSAASRKVWNLDTNQFHPVTVLMNSPNYWDGQEGIGHRHFFFMLKNCVSDETPNGFFNEFLREELLEQKRVFEALGAEMRVQPVDDQLSGIGFSSTKRNSIICKIESGNVSRTLKINI